METNVAKDTKVKELTGAQVAIASDEPELAAPYATDWLKKVREMRKDPTINLARNLVIAPALAAKWSYEAKEEAPEEARDFIESVMEPIRLHLLRNAFNGWLDFGWAPFEKIFAYDELSKFITVKKLKPLLQDLTTILVDPKTGSYQGLFQKVGDVETTLNLEQTLLMSCDTEGTDWYGRAIMKNSESAYDAWQDVAVSATRYDQRIAGSHWIVYYPLGTSNYEGVETDNFEIAKKILNSLQASGRVAVPRMIDALMEETLSVAGNVKDGGWRVDILTDAGAGSSSFIERMKYLDALKVRGLNLPERSALEGQFGTKAESEAHADFAITSMELRHQLAVQDVNWHVINQLLVLNWGPTAENTVFARPSPIADRTLSFLRELYKAIIASPDGFASETLTIDMGALKDKLGIPVDELEEDLDDDLNIVRIEDKATGMGKITAPMIGQGVA